MKCNRCGKEIELKNSFSITTDRNAHLMDLDPISIVICEDCYWKLVAFLDGCYTQFYGKEENI